MKTAFKKTALAVSKQAVCLVMASFVCATAMPCSALAPKSQIKESTSLPRDWDAVTQKRLDARATIETVQSAAEMQAVFEFFKRRGIGADQENFLMRQWDKGQEGFMNRFMTLVIKEDKAILGAIVVDKDFTLEDLEWMTRSTIYIASPMAKLAVLACVSGERQRLMEHQLLLAADRQARLSGYVTLIAFAESDHEIKSLANAGYEGHSYFDNLYVRKLWRPIMPATIVLPSLPKGTFYHPVMQAMRAVEIRETPVQPAAKQGSDSAPAIEAPTAGQTSDKGSDATGARYKIDLPVVGQTASQRKIKLARRKAERQQIMNQPRKSKQSKAHPSPTSIPARQQDQDFSTQAEEIFNAHERMTALFMNHLHTQGVRATNPDLRAMEAYFAVFLLRDRETQEWRNRILQHLTVKGVITRAEVQPILESMESGPDQTLNLLLPSASGADSVQVHTLYSYWIRWLLAEEPLTAQLVREADLSKKWENIPMVIEGHVVPMQVFLAIPPEQWPRYRAKLAASQKAIVADSYGSPQARAAARKDMFEALRAQPGDIGSTYKSGYYAGAAGREGLLSRLDRQRILKNLELPPGAVTLSTEDDRMKFEQRQQQSVPAIVLNRNEVLRQYHAGNKWLKMARVVEAIDRVLQVGGEVHAIADSNTPLALYKLFRGAGYELIRKEKIDSVNGWPDYLLLTFRKIFPRPHAQDGLKRFLLNQELPALIVPNFLRPKELPEQRMAVQSQWEQIPSPLLKELRPQNDQVSAAL